MERKLDSRLFFEGVVLLLFKVVNLMRKHSGVERKKKSHVPVQNSANHQLNDPCKPHSFCKAVSSSINGGGNFCLLPGTIVLIELDYTWESAQRKYRSLYKCWG